MEKVCNKCGESKPLDQFPQPKNRPGPSSPCKACAVERVRRWKSANTERAKANDRAAYERLRNDPEAWAQNLAQQREDGRARTRAKSPKGKTFAVECKRCGESFEYVFHRRYRTVCDLCRRNDGLWKKFGLTGPQAEQLRAQGYCDICSGTEPRGHYNEWHIDHDHATGEIRGLLCAHCNTALGLLGDDPDRMRRAADYLEAHAAVAPA
jgi:hypothetical protein